MVDDKSAILRQRKRQRGSMKAKLTSFRLFLETLGSNSEVEEQDIINLEQRLERLKELITDYDACQSEIEQLTEDSELDECYTQRTEFETEFYALTSKAQKLSNELRPEQANVEQSSEVGSDIASQNSIPLHRKIKLPQLKLPQFDGSYDKWPTFHDMFHSIIHSDDRIDTIAKFQYLQSSLTGEALRILDGLEISSVNYESAWNLLIRRYQNRNLMIHKHIGGIIDSPKLAKEDHEALRRLVDSTRGHMRALVALKQPVDKWDSLLIHLVSDKLDTNSKKEWEKELAGDEELPDMEKFLDFLEKRCQLLEKINKHMKATNEAQTTRSLGKHKGGSATLAHTAITKSNCPLCEGEHALHACRSFLDMSIPSRIEQVKKKKICLNCLKSGHFAVNCKSQKCRRCSKLHNTLLHLGTNEVTEAKNKENKQVDKAPEAKNENKEVISAHSAVENFGHLLLPTAMVKIIGQDGRIYRCSALLDSGSQSNFITTNLCNKVGLHTNKVDFTVAGINHSQTKILETTKATIRSMYNDYEEKLTFMVTPRITSSLPSESLDIQGADIPANIPLADPNFHRPKKIDILIGVDHFWNLICHEPSNHPYLYKTKLGYIVSGKFPQRSDPGTTVSCNLAISTAEISRNLERFWRIEELPEQSYLSTEEQSCESHFMNTTKRDNNGRFVVSIPFKASTEILGDSKELAVKRFKSVERKLQANDVIRYEYVAFMRKYQDLGHMKKVVDDYSTIQACYLPHHGVVKEDSLTTKLRVVFDASAPTSTGISLNDIQMVGPTIQRDLLSIILSFRQHPYVIGADIAMMYHQIWIEPSQRIFQRILWREDPSEHLDTYELSTVTYGMASSPFLAIRCLFAVAEEHQKTYPDAANIIRKFMYVDDLLFGASSKEEAIRLAKEISHILSSGCFDLRKWISNDPQILERIGAASDDHQFIKFDETKTTKTLGLSWSCTDDALIYHVNLEAGSEPTTKRAILSLIARLYDPLGLLGPCIIVAKIMLQMLWKLKLSWDDSLPTELQTKWSQFAKEFILLNNLSIPRQVCCSLPQRIEIHGFSDASEIAYGGCVYIRSINETGSTFTRLLCAKSKVAPLKPLTIPKLELSAAHLLTKLVTKVKAAFDVKIESVYYWSDSTIVLSWLRIEPHRLQTFVRNRVVEIRAQSSVDKWKHTPSSDNPADWLCRGVFPQTLIDTKLWWHGPGWLAKPKDEWPTTSGHVIVDLPEVKELSFKVNALHTMIKGPLIKFQDHSKLERLVRIVAFCQRFIKIKVYRLPAKGPFTAEEIHQSTIALIRLAQLDSFSEEIRALSTDKTIGTRSKILSLNPFIHHDGTLRVGGRLRHSSFEFDKKHPMILNAKHPLTRLIFTSEHKRLLHVGPQTLLAHTRERYWTIAGRNLARQVVHQCIRCFRCKPKGITPQMADLPQDRVTPAPVFFNVGTDYAGPFSIKDRKGRGCKISKAYVCLFICMATKAIHLELVTDLTTENFILALRRFTSRRGRPSKISSDNGTNFIGAHSELQRLGEFLASNESELQDRLVTEGINWTFIPAYSPHFGGIWEAGIKSTKHHLQRVIGGALLTYEEFYSVLVQVEAILNSRPLSPLSTHPLDLQPLTPAHFIIGRTLTTVPYPNVIDVNENRLSRYQRIQQVQQNFWKRWSKEFISELQRRVKWKTNVGILKIGDLVLVKEDNVPPLHWRLGRVSELHPGTDSITRAATVRTVKGFIRRATAKLCPLPIEDAPMESRIAQSSDDKPTYKSPADSVQSGQSSSNLQTN